VVYRHVKSLQNFKAFEGTDEMTFCQRMVGSTRGHDLPLYKKRFKLEVKKL